MCNCCSVDEPELGHKQVQATFTISSHAAQDDIAPATDNELINTWWMAFVNEENIVTRLLERPADKTEAVEREEFTFNIDAGTYTIYAFANIERGTIEDNITEGQPIREGQPMPVLPTLWNKEIGPIESLVPMTGVDHITFEEGKENSLEVEVVRLWAKLRFEFRTDMAQSIKVNKISMTPALTQAINLLPDYNSLGKAPELPDETICSTLEKNTDITVTNDEKTALETFYLFESTAKNHPTGHYPISFELQYENGTTRTADALAYELEYINRNDFITIPVFITNWNVDVSVLFYPPIGGYPAIITDKKDDEFYAKFGSPGKFVIRPTVSSADGTIVSNSNLEISLATTDNDEILSQSPTYDSNTSEIIGEIATEKYGTAIITLSIKIKTNESLQHTITRKFYIIRENS